MGPDGPGRRRPPFQIPNGLPFSFPRRLIPGGIGGRPPEPARLIPGGDRGGRPPRSQQSPAGQAPLALGAGGLAALYAGTPVATLRRAGLADGGSPDADAALDGAFAATPFMLDGF